MSGWPAAQLNPVRQLRVLAEVLPGVGLVERVLDAPYERVWSFLADLDHSVAAFDPMVRSLRVLSNEGSRLVVVTRTSFLPLSSRFEVELREGWCLMRSRTDLVGMAAEPQGQQTRYAHLEGLPYHRARALRLLRPVFPRVVQGDIHRNRPDARGTSTAMRRAPVSGAVSR